MIPLHHCADCGFISTRVDQFRRIDQNTQVCLFCADYREIAKKMREEVKEKLPLEMPNESY
jgi:hypothetical protein